MKVSRDLEVNTLEISASEGLVSEIPRDYHSKKGLCYIAYDRQTDSVLLAQSLALLVLYINNVLSCGERWDNVSVTGLFDNCDFHNGRSGGWCKGRYRIISRELKHSKDVFEGMRNQSKTGFVLFHPKTPTWKYPKLSKVISNDVRREREEDEGGIV